VGGDGVGVEGDKSGMPSMGLLLLSLSSCSARLRPLPQAWQHEREAQITEERGGRGWGREEIRVLPVCMYLFIMFSMRVWGTVAGGNLCAVAGAHLCAVAGGTPVRRSGVQWQVVYLPA